MTAFGAALHETPVDYSAGAFGAPNQALSELFKILLCGEESAGLAFDVLGRRRQRRGDSQELTAALARIAADEREHGALLRQTLAHLPAPRVDHPFELLTRDFFLGLASPDAGVHFTRIAALDSAVCLLLAALRRSMPRLFGAALHRILTDEARHVAVTNGYARRLELPGRRFDTAVETRARLVSLLERRAGCLETLQMNPGALLKRLRQPPRFLCR
jgi:hypothetical protein